MHLAITGGTSGIGKEKVKALAPKFSKIFLLVRNTEKAQELIDSIESNGKNDKFVIIPCDLADLSSVAEATEKVKSKTDEINVLINNAGGIFPERKVTKDNLELTFSANHMGHFLLTLKLMPLLLKTNGARIINVSSEAHKAASVNFKDLQSEIKFSSFRAYANVKLFNILFTKSLAEKFGDQGIYAYAYHPGVVNTNFGHQSKGIFKLLISLFKPFMVSPSKGAETGVYFSTSSDINEKNGKYFKKSKVAKPSDKAQSKIMREKLWDASEKLVSTYL